MRPCQPIASHPSSAFLSPRKTAHPQYLRPNCASPMTSATFCAIWANPPTTSLPSLPSVSHRLNYYCGSPPSRYLCLHALLASSLLRCTFALAPIFTRVVSSKKKACFACHLRISRLHPSIPSQFALSTTPPSSLLKHSHPCAIIGRRLNLFKTNTCSARWHPNCSNHAGTLPPPLGIIVKVASTISSVLHHGFCSVKELGNHAFSRSH